MVEIIIILITVAIIFYILLPLFFKKRIKTRVSSDVSELTERKEILERDLSDLYFDYQMGKLTDDDFNSLQNDYSNEIDEIIDDSKNIIKSPRSHRKTEIVNKDTIEECPKCGRENSVKNKYCANCGFKLK